MSRDVDQSFVNQYQTDVHVAYQRKQSRLRGTVRTRNGVVGAKAIFQKMGKGSAGQKTRHGKVPVMNVDHTPVEVILEDWYAGDWADKLDLNKLLHAERLELANAGAYALGRKTDEIIVDAMMDTTNTTPNTVAADGSTGSASGMNRGKAIHAMEALGSRDVPLDDGDSFVAVGWKQWGQLLAIDEFANADYVGADALPWQGGAMTGKRWLNALWFPFSGLPKTGNDRNCFWWHRSAIGHAIAADVQADITWHGDHAAWFINNMMTMGAGLIDADGVQEILCTE